MHGQDGAGCEFCDVDRFRTSTLFLENELCLYAGQMDVTVLPGAGIVIPRRHVESPFALNPEEWAATGELIIAAKQVIDARLAPDGYNLGWNVMPTAGQEVAHVHLHVIPRFADEPEAGKGIRWLFRQDHNVRPDPSARGEGAASGPAGHR